jgi:uncharacterized protein (TIGR02996 family)
MPFHDEGFFHALQQNPNDDALRLIYADYLEDQGDPDSVGHAELIRVQVELAALLPTCRREVERSAVLAQRQRELLALWERRLLGDWVHVLDGWSFRRGFVEAVRVDASVFLQNAPNWFAEWPTLATVKLTRAAGHLAELAHCPWLAHLRGLDLSDNEIDTEALAHLTSSRFICLLQALDLSRNPIGARGAGLVATANDADELSELHLAHSGLRGDGLTRLLGGRARQWRRLDLSDNSIYRRDLVALVDSPVMANLLALDLALNSLSDNGASLIADSPNAAGLVHLGLCGTRTGNLDVVSLAGSPHLRSLRSLDLRGHQCWSDLSRAGENRGGIYALAQSPLLGQLRRLLLAETGPSNGWTADILSLGRPRRRPTVTPGYWVATQLRESKYLMPSQLIECDLEELWWLGDPANRERLPSLWEE